MVGNETQSQKSSPHREGPPYVVAVLQALGFIDLIATLVGVLVVLALRVQQSLPLDATSVALLLGALVAGITLGGLLIGLAAALRYAHELVPGGRQDALHGSYYGGPGAPEATHLLAADEPVGFAPSDAAQIATLLTDIRDLQLLGPEEREQTAERLRVRAERRAADEVIDAINTRQLGRARVLLRYAEATYGGTPTIERLQAKIEEAAKRNEALDFARTRRHVADAIGEGQWILAEQYAHQLYVDHPDSVRCRQLWDDTRRARLYAHIQECAEQHRWSEALAAAEEFIGRFPGSRESEALRRQMDTLRTNAEIVQRRQYEKRFKEFLSGQHYADALRIARHVVEQFPQSPQAHALRDQIPILEKRVSGESFGSAPPAPP